MWLAAALLKCLSSPPWERRTAMNDRIRRDQDDIDLDDLDSLPDEGGGIAEAAPESEDEEFDEDDD
jgi:hypothetical protein